MKGTCHKGVIIRRVAEYNKLGASERILLLCQPGCFLYDLTKHLDCIHVNTGPSRSDIDGTADKLCLSQCLGNGFDQQLICRGHSFGNQSGIAAQEIDSAGLCRLIQGQSDLYEIFCLFAAGTAYQSNRGHRNSLVNDRDTVLQLDFLADADQIFSL